MKKILITGSEGMLGQAAVEYFKKEYQDIKLDIVPNSGYQCDITKEKEIKKIIEKELPDYVLHCAALINVNYCENHKDQAYKLNWKATNNIKKLCHQYNSKLIYISSSMIFDGKRNKPYTEYDIPRPLNHYAQSKLWGEENCCGNDLIIRTNIIGMKPGSFFYWLYQSILDNIPVEMYKDLYFNAMYVKDLIPLIHNLLLNNDKGIWNITSRDSISKYKFAKLLERMIGINGNIKPVKYKSAIPRPKKAILDCSKYEKEYYVKLPTVKETINNILEDLE